VLGAALLMLTPAVVAGQDAAASGRNGDAKAPAGPGATLVAPDRQDLALARYLEASRALPAANPFG